MVIPEYKNGHFEEMAALSQILQIEGNSTLIYLSFDTHDTPWPSSYRNGKFLDLMSLCDLALDCN